MAPARERTHDEDDVPGLRWRRRFALAMGALMVLFIAATVLAVVLIGPVTRAFVGPCGRDAAASPRSVIAASRLDDYEQRNLALLSGFTADFGPPQVIERGFEYRCSINDPGSGVVGVRSSVIYALPDGTARCDAVRKIEARLRSEGWTVRSLETTSPTGAGFVGATDATRGEAYLQLSVHPDATSFRVTVEHEGSPAALPADAPSMSCQ